MLNDCFVLFWYQIDSLLSILIRVQEIYINFYAHLKCSNFNSYLQYLKQLNKLKIKLYYHQFFKFNFEIFMKVVQLLKDLSFQYSPYSNSRSSTYYYITKDFSYLFQTVNFLLILHLKYLIFKLSLLVGLFHILV